MPTQAETGRKAGRGAAGEDAVVAGVRLSNPDKLLYEDQGLTKRDMARYLEKVAPVMLPHVANRLVTLVRCPGGSTGQCFYQRHIGTALPDTFRQLEVAPADGGAEVEAYIYVADTAGLVAAAQVGGLELHIWGCHVDDVERPDRLAFDLDPGEGVPFEDVKRGATDMRSALEDVGLASHPLLTGGKGLHVVVPMRRRYEWPVVKSFCRAVAERLADSAPDRYLVNMSKAKRRGRIFLDYLRNERSATAIAPFSPRARDGAPVAWPVEWDELPDIGSAAEVRVRDVLSARRAPVSWKGYEARQQITARALAALDVQQG